MQKLQIEMNEQCSFSEFIRAFFLLECNDKVFINKEVRRGFD
jgi:hypothetical protein